MNGKKIVGMVMAAMLLATSAVGAAAAERYNDMEEITSHVKLKLPNTLQISRPAGETATNEAGYFIAGSSVADQPLTMNGETVTTRGKRGSFGVYVPVEQAVNTFVFKQGGKSETVTIRKGVDLNAAKISNIRRMAPDYHFAVAKGESALLSCEAPSGASVTAAVDGQTIRLKQKTQTQAEGVPARFEAVFTPAGADKTRSLGEVTYSMTYQNKTSSQRSAGQLFAAGDRLVVQVCNNAASIYDTEQHGKFDGEGRLGAVDYVTQIGQTDYQLASGGWIPHSSVTPLGGNVAVKNKVSDARYQAESGGEILQLTGSSHPMFRASQTAQTLTVKLMNTTGVKAVLPDISDSSLYSGVQVSEEDGATTLVFSLSGKQGLWGYDVSYKDGVTSIYSKYRPKLKTGSQPLTGVTVAIDPGHGGDDPGAIGMPGLAGAVESEINYMTAVAIQKRLQSLGATVVMTRGEKDTVSLNERMEITQRERADLFLAVHSNSIGFVANSNNAKGVESYYYDDISKKLAAAVNNNIASYTGRTSRGAKFSNFRVTMNSFCPSVLIELGFVTNPGDYDQLTSKNSIFQTANAVGDAVISALS